MSPAHKTLAWNLLARLHALDFRHLLPFMARLPLWLGYRLAGLRARFNALSGRDWRSMALGFRHVAKQTEEGLRLLEPGQSSAWFQAQRALRFRTEAREEFEARLVAAGRLGELECEWSPAALASLAAGRERGLVLLTPHFESFFVGVGFLARCGSPVNLMTSAVTHDPRVCPPVQDHFATKYSALEKHLNGGITLDMEAGLRPFYDMLNRRETLVVLADAPAQPGGADMERQFLGRTCGLAAGALRMARKTGSDIGCYVCRHVAPGHYRMEIGPCGPSENDGVVDRIYDFFSQAILPEPGKWWALDLFPAMVRTEQASTGTERV